MTEPTATDDDAIARALHRSRCLCDAPEDLVQRALALFESRAPAPTPAVGGGATATLRRLAAVLTFDSGGATPLAFGRRGPAQPGRQLLYALDGRDIDLRLAPIGAPASARWRITGQVLGPDLGGRIELQRGEVRRGTTWGPMGEFAFDDVGPGSVTVWLQGTDWTAELPPLQVGAPGG